MLWNLKSSMTVPAASESHASGEANSAARGRRSGLHQRGILDYSIAFHNIKATKKI
jgi:hypothetical protein